MRAWAWRRLLEKSGAPRGSLYFHFPGGKQQIGAEVVARVGAEVAGRFRDLHESGVDIDTFIERVFKTTAKESKERDYKRLLPDGRDRHRLRRSDEKLAAAVRDAFNSWEARNRAAAQRPRHERRQRGGLCLRVLDSDGRRVRRLQGARHVGAAHQRFARHPGARGVVAAELSAIDPRCKTATPRVVRVDVGDVGLAKKRSINAWRVAAFDQIRLDHHVRRASKPRSESVRRASAGGMISSHRTARRVSRTKIGPCWRYGVSAGW